MNYFLDDRINNAAVLFPGVGCFLIAACLGSWLHASNVADIDRKLGVKRGGDMIDRCVVRGHFVCNAYNVPKALHANVVLLLIITSDAEVQCCSCYCSSCCHGSTILAASPTATACLTPAGLAYYSCLRPDA